MQGARSSERSDDSASAENGPTAQRHKGFTALRRYGIKAFGCRVGKLNVSSYLLRIDGTYYLLFTIYFLLLSSHYS